MQRFISTIAALTGVLILVQAAGSLLAAEPTANEREAAIHKALDDKTNLEFVETPLQDVAAFLAEKHKFNVQLDKKALDDAGLGFDTPVTKYLKDVSLRSALKLLLREFDLTSVVENEVLLITTMDVAQQKLRPRVYDVADLVAADGHTDYDSLIETITATVHPSSWDDVGGPGSVSALMGTLVISQTEAVHEDINRLLAELRRVRQARGDARPAPAAADATVDPQAVTVKVYKVAVPLMLKPGPALPVATSNNGSSVGAGAEAMAGVLPSYAPHDRYLQELTQAIPAVLSPETWERAGGPGVIHSLPADAGGTGQLLVRQTAQVHNQLQQFLHELPRATGGVAAAGGFGGAQAGLGGGFF